MKDANPTVLSRLATEVRDAERTQIDADIGEIRSAAREYYESALVCDTPSLQPMRRARNLRGNKLVDATERYELLYQRLLRTESDLARARAEAEVSFEERTRLREALFFFASVIRSGEPWSEQCDAAFSRATAPLHEIEADLVSHLASLAHQETP